MRIAKLTLDNFRCFSHLEVELKPGCNTFIGINGSGKTSLLNAFKLAAGAFVLGLDSNITVGEEKHISIEDLRFVPVDVLSGGIVVNRNIKRTPPTRFECTGYIDGQTDEVKWERERTQEKESRTTTKGLAPLFEIVSEMEKREKSGSAVSYPVIVYYSTARLFLEGNDMGKSPEKRFDAYYKCLSSSSSVPFFKKWMKEQEDVLVQNSSRHGKAINPYLDLLKKVIGNFLSDAQDIYFHKTIKDVVVEFEDGRLVPYAYLSDGTRNVISLLGDLAMRCATLNPHLTDQANQSSGVVMIDEVDLHLHPSWQKKIVRSLRVSFPNIQFILTTHSPKVLSGHFHDEEEQVFVISDNQVYAVGKTYGRDINNILECAMDEESQDGKVKDMFSQYFDFIHQGNGEDDKALEIRKNLENILGEDYSRFSEADALIFAMK